MGKQRNIIVSLHDFAALGKNTVHVTFAANDLRRFTGGLLQFLLVLRGIVGFVRPVVPDDIQFLAALKCCPSVIRDHCDAAQRLEGRRRLERIDGQRLTHSGYFQSLFIVVGFHFAADNGRMLDGGVDHAVHAGVHAIDRFPVAQLLQIGARHTLADITP